MRKQKHKKETEKIQKRYKRKTQTKNNQKQKNTH